MAVPSISTDQLIAFVELSRQGSIRAAAETLFISEQGVRSRLITLEDRLGVTLYEKSRGVRTRSPLTEHGRFFLPKAVSLLEKFAELEENFQSEAQLREVHVAASQYLIAYMLIDVVRRFQKAHSDIKIRLSAKTEQEIESALNERPNVAIGVAAPYESSAEFEFYKLFSMSWSLIARRGNSLLKKKSLKVSDLANQPLLVYERGSTGRQHVMDAFHHSGVTPNVVMEATNTDLIVRMVEAGLGVAVVPLHPSGEVTRGRRVETISLGRQIREIDSGILLRKNQPLTKAAKTFVEFLKTQAAKK